MKVIGITTNGFLIEASKEEIANLQGICYVDSRFKYPSAGDEINISDVYRKIQSMAYANRFESALSEAENAVKTLTLLTEWAKNTEIAELKYQSKPSPAYH